MDLRAKLVFSIGLLSLLWLMLPGSLWADGFTFSFTGTSGNVSGTVTGEILGLTNNSTSPAGGVILDSYPALFTSAPDLSTTPVDVTSWSDVSFNIVTETAGSITAYDFDAATATGGPISLLYLASGDGTLYGDFGGQGYILVGPVTFAPLVSTVPEPGTNTLMLIGIGLLGLIMVIRKRIA
jgi:hypothetical protein